MKKFAFVLVLVSIASAQNVKKSRNTVCAGEGNILVCVMK